MTRTSSGWMEEYIKRKAFWFHDRKPRRPHAILTSGMHSEGFFNSGIISENPLLLSEAASDLVRLLRENKLNVQKVDRVVGPAMGAITLVHDVARHLGLIRKNYFDDKTCLCSYTEKEMIEGKEIMSFKKTSIRKGENILLVEDVLTTCASIEKTAKAVLEAGGVILPFVGSLVNRSVNKETGGKKIIALIDFPMHTWTKDQCPLCRMGSVAIRPKGNENWQLLNANY